METILNQRKILVTGASGFIGSFLVEGALERGMQTWAGIRRTSSRKYLQDERATNNYNSSDYCFHLHKMDSPIYF